MCAAHFYLKHQKLRALDQDVKRLYIVYGTKLIAWGKNGSYRLFQLSKLLESESC